MALNTGVCVVVMGLGFFLLIIFLSYISPWWFYLRISGPNVPTGDSVVTSEPAEPPEKIIWNIFPKGLPWTAQRFGFPMWFLSKPRVLKTPQGYRETVSHQHKIRIHSRSNPEGSGTRDFSGHSKWLKCQSRKSTVCVLQRGRLPVNPVKVFYKGWPGMSMNFPSKVNPVWVFQYCNESQTRAESHPFVQTLDMGFALWGLSLGDGREDLFLLLLWKQNGSTSLAQALCSLREKAGEAAIKKFSKMWDKICLRYTFRGNKIKQHS